MDNSDASDTSNFKELLTMPSGIKAIPTTVVCQMKIEDPDILNKLYTSCIGSKLMRIIRRNKGMTITSNKLEEVHADLWRPHDLPS